MTDTPETAPEVTQDYSEQALANRQIDFLETRAEEWMSDGGVQRMFNAIASVFEPYAPQEIMDRFREKLGAIGIQCHIEGALRAWEEIAAQQKALGRPLPADADEIERHRTTPEAARQDVREALAEAYRKGATDVHTYWQRNPGEPPQGDPEFGEAASDYAAAAMDIHDSSAALSTSPLANDTGALRGMETAPKDGSYILAVYKSLDGYAEQLHGRAFVVRHEGQTPSGYDLGWALFPGHGGVPDKCFSGWVPLPAALASPDDGEGK